MLHNPSRPKSALAAAQSLLKAGSFTIPSSSCCSCSSSDISCQLPAPAAREGSRSTESPRNRFVTASKPRAALGMTIMCSTGAHVTVLFVSLHRQYHPGRTNVIDVMPSTSHRPQAGMSKAMLYSTCPCVWPARLQLSLSWPSSFAACWPMPTPQLTPRYCTIQQRMTVQVAISLSHQVEYSSLLL